MLTPEEYAFLIILKAVGRELSNTEMNALFQTRLIGAAHKKLTGEELVSSVKKGSTYWLTHRNRAEDGLRTADDRGRAVRKATLAGRADAVGRAGRAAAER